MSKIDKSRVVGNSRCPPCKTSSFQIECYLAKKKNLDE
jgi:hypothetical protein